jgi:hypothetical protein
MAYMWSAFKMKIVGRGGGGGRKAGKAMNPGDEIDLRVGRNLETQHDRQYATRFVKRIMQRTACEIDEGMR